MKKRIILIVFLIMAVVMLDAETKSGVHKESFGLMITVESLTTPVNNFTDGVISGLGAKYWITPEIPVRALVFLNMMSNSTTDETTTRFGASAGVEYHFVKGLVSPYAGALAGIELLNDEELAADYHLGAMLGVEITPLDYLSLYLEYRLLAIFNELGTEIDLGYSHAPAFGAVFYFN
ncbi:MAG: hypothetical protein EHM28_00130 [Spirochaetaceae bacterium]|nr:MAG: hypothetical protein EHM28_00130 [Spirochaetaceae bacterium]